MNLFRRSEDERERGCEGVRETGGKKVSLVKRCMLVCFWAKRGVRQRQVMKRGEVREERLTKYDVRRDA